MRSLIFILCLLGSHWMMGQEWTPIWDGESLTDWKQVGAGSFIIEDGMLKTQGGMGLLYYTPGALENVQIKVIFKNPNGMNSGIFIRIPEAPTEAWMPVNKGYEVQIDDSGDEYHITGVLYSLTKALATPSIPDEWNTMIITLDGEKTLVHINDILVTDFSEGDPVPEKTIWYEPDRGRRPVKGYIGLQNHADDDVVYFREISIRPILE